MAWDIPDFLLLMESKDEIRPAEALKNPMR
jgi:hypothetical protein